MDGAGRTQHYRGADAPAADSLHLGIDGTRTDLGYPSQRILAPG